jgi:hypothetical protein
VLLIPGDISPGCGGEKELPCMIPRLGVRWTVHETYLKIFVVFYGKC